MQIIPKLTKYFAGFRKKRKDSGTWEEVLGSDEDPSGILNSRLTGSSAGSASDLKYYRSYSYACINARAENTAKAKIFLYKKLSDNSRQNKNLIEIHDHPFLDLISTNNIYGLSFFEIIYSIIVQLDLFGNAYVYYPKNSLGMPADLILLTDPARMKITRLPDHKLKYIYAEGTKEIIYSSDEIIHFKFPSPASMLYGKSTISSIKDILTSEIYQSKYQLSFYKNDANPGVILELAGEMSSSNYNRFVKNWNAKFRGPENSNKVTILENGMKVSGLKNTPREIDFINTRKEVRDEIFSIFRVPKVVLAITDQVNYANAYAGLTSFILNTIIPLSKFIESKLDSFVKQNYDKALSVKLEYDTFENEKVKLDQQKLLIETGTITKNELRAMVGLGEV